MNRTPTGNLSKPRTASPRSPEKPTKPRKKLFSTAESELVGKDIAAIWGNGGLRSLLMFLPVVLVVIFPVAAYVAVNLLPVPTALSPKIMAMLSGGASGQAANSKQVWMEAFTKLLCPLLYLCVPVITAVATAAASFVGEKEERTLDSLFLSAMSPRSVFNTKVTACSLISLLISWISFAVFFITVSILDVLLETPFFFTADWLVISVLLTPVLILFSVVFVTRILKRVHGVSEVLQTAGYILFPFTLLYVAQFTGAFHLGPLALLGIAVVLAVAAVVLFNISAGNFNSEVLFTKESLDRDQPL